MHLRLPAALALVAALFCGDALAAGHVTKGPTPAWVDELAIPKPREARLRQTEDGVYYLIDDAQIRPEAARTVTYYRTTSKVIDRGGLESAARLDVEFDPSYEDVVIHRLRVLRGDAALDRLDETKVQILQREKDLDDGIMDGRETAHLDIPDVHVGDVVDIAYSIVSGSTFWPGNYFATLQVQWEVPLAIGRERLLWPSAWKLTARNRNVRLAPSRKAEGDRTIYEWRTDDDDPLASEKDTPAWYASWGELSLSSMESWAGIVDRTLPLYAAKDKLPPELVERVRAIEAKFPRPEDRITEALRLVQDELRYVSLSMGQGSYVPRNAAEVFRSGFGDCKDKASLLAAILNSMGIEAHVALTDIDEGRALPEHAPSPYVFGHAITMVKYAGRNWWLEPTRSHEGGRFPDLAGVPYDWALPLVAGQKTLERISPPAAPAPAEITTERFVAGADGGLSLHVTTYDLGQDADWMRDNIVSKSPAQIEKDYLKYYAAIYPGLVVAEPVRFTDDRDANRIAIYESYRLSAADLHRNALDTKFPVKASSMSVYDNAPSEGRRTPYTLDFPVNKQHTIVVVTPHRRPQVPGAVAIDDPLFAYNFDARQKDDTLTLRYRLVGKTDALMPKDIARYRADSAAVKDANYWELDLARTGDTAGAPGRDRAKAIWLIAATILVAIALYALHLGLHADDTHAKDAQFYPVDRVKFLTMSAATAGLYPLFWAWKCWRWTVIREKQVIAPFWRAFFSMFWLYPLFANANRRTVPPPVSNLLGIAAAAAYLLMTLGDGVAAVLYPSPLIDILTGLLPGFFFLPALDAVNALNRGRSTALEENSKVTGLTLIALIAGVAIWTGILGGVSWN